MNPRPAPSVSPISIPETAPTSETGATRPSEATDEPESDPRIASFRVVGLAVVWVSAVALAEYVTVQVDVRWGLIAHAALIAMATIVAMAATYQAHADGATGPRGDRLQLAHWWVAVALAPLFRVVSLAMPLDSVAPPNRYGLVAAPLIVAAALTMRANRYRRRDVGLVIPRSWWRLPLTGIVAAGGLAIGYVEFRTGSVTPLVAWSSPPPQLAAAAVLLLVAAFAEEFVFRGVVQRATSDLMGPIIGVVFGALLYASLGVGQEHPSDVALAFGIAALFGSTVIVTRSLLGAVLARGIAYVCLLILFPHFL